MKSLYIFLAIVLFSCSSPEKFNLNQPLYRLTGSDTYLYFTGDSVRWISDLFRNNTSTFYYKKSGNSVFLVYRNGQYVELSIRKNELVYVPQDDSFDRMTGLNAGKELKFRRVSDEDAGFLFSRISLLQEISSTIISDLKSRVPHPEDFLYHSLSLKSSHSALAKDIPDLELSLTWWNTMNGKKWQWNQNRYHIVIQGNKWQTVETKSEPVNMGEVVHP